MKWRSYLKRAAFCEVLDNSIIFCLGRIAEGDPRRKESIACMSKHRCSLLPATENIFPLSKLATLAADLHFSILKRYVTWLLFIYEIKSVLLIARIIANGDVEEQPRGKSKPKFTNPKWKHTGIQVYTQVRVKKINTQFHLEVENFPREITLFSQRAFFHGYVI